MARANRKVVGTRLLILTANLLTIAVIVKVATVSPKSAVVIAVACVLAVLVLQRREVAGLIHRMTGR